MRFSDEMNNKNRSLPFWSGTAEGKLKLLRLVITLPAGILGAYFLFFVIQLSGMTPEEKAASMERRAETLRSMVDEDRARTENGKPYYMFYRS